MTRPDPSPTELLKTMQAELEFNRRLILGLLGTLESRGLLGTDEVNNVIRAARQASGSGSLPNPAAQPSPAAQALAQAARDARKVQTKWPEAGNNQSPAQMMPKKAEAAPEQGEPPASAKAGETVIPVVDVKLE